MIAGELPYSSFRKEDVERSRDKRSRTPGAADKLVKHLRAMFKWSIDKKYMLENPAATVAKINTVSEGWHTWTPTEVETYRKRHEIGTKARLALELMLNLGARISDAVRIGRQHEDGYRWLKFVAWKNRNKRSRKTIQCMILPKLAKALGCTPARDMTYMINDLGRPFSINGFGNKIRDWCKAAGLPHCSALGLRKAAAVELAENGATAAELCAVFGWSKLETAEIYIRKANQRRLAENAFVRLDERRNQQSVSVVVPRRGNETKRGKSLDKSKRK